MNPRLKSSMLRLLLAHVIPVIGLMFFEWRLFEIAVTYVLESAALFVVFNFHHCFLDKTTEGAGGGFFMFAIALVPVAGLMFAFFAVLYFVTGEYKHGHWTELLVYRLMEMNYLAVLGILILLELITFYSYTIKSAQGVQLNFFKVMKRFFFNYLFVFSSLVLVIITLGNPVLMSAVVLLLKLLFDVVNEYPQALKKMLKYISDQ